MSPSPSARPLRVLQIVHGLPRGGLENGLVNLLNGLPPEGFEQAVCCLDSRGEMAERVGPGIPIRVLDRGRHDLRLPLRLAREIRAFSPDLIHCRNWNTWLDTVLAHRLAGRRGTLIWSFHGFADGHWFPKRRQVASRYLARATDRLCAVCRDSALRYAALSGIQSGAFDVLYNGVDCTRFAPPVDRSALKAALGLPSDRPTLLTVASLTPVKGHDLLLEAAARALSASGRAAHFLWLGEGALRAQLEARRAALGLDGAVAMPGGSDRVADYLAAADIFVLPSRLEGMSNAILEAMASGLPVVAHSVGGNPELIEDGRTGILCPDGDVPALARAISTLIEDPALRLAMGEAARHRALTVFSLGAMMSRYAEYYRAAAQGSRRPAGAPREQVA